jgi:hypothetical protein
MIPKALVLSLLAATSVLAQPITLSVRWVDDYGAPKGVTFEARKDAARILAAAGVRLDWQQAEEPADLTLYLLARAMLRTSGDALGYTAIDPSSASGCNFAHLLYPAIEQTARGSETAVSTILGAAMAHEIGHILLNSTAHSPSGIMTATFGYKQTQQAGKRQLLFTTDQAAHIRAQVALRHMIPQPASGSM